MNQYDKPRIASTIIIGIFTTLCLIATIIILPFDWSTVKEAVDNTAESSDSAAGAVVGGFAVALFGVLGIALVFIVAVANAINSSICLPFAIKNKKSTLKPIRIISYVYDGIIGSLLLVNVIKIIILIATAQS